MMLEVDLRSYLLAQSSLQTFVVDRIYGLTRPQAAALPAIMLQRSTSARQVLLCGTDKLVDTQMQVDCFAISGEDAWNLARAIRQLLVDLRA